MFKKQQFLLHKAPEIKTILMQYNQPEEWVNQLICDCQQFVVRFPLVGAFSSGKSSLLNALIGESIFATSIDPQTAIPAELSYGDVEVFVGRTPSGSTYPLNREMVRAGELAPLQPDGWIDARMPVAHLAKLPHLLLVDMPGWDSGIEGHARAIDQYASRSLAYGVVVSAEEGNLRESLRTALLELQILEMPIVVIISKCEKKTAEEIDAVTQHVKLEVENAIGKQPLAIARVSARKKDIGQFVEALEKLETQSEVLFNKTVTTSSVRYLKQFAHYLNMLLNKDDLDSEQIEIKCQNLMVEIRSFENDLNAETQALDAKVQTINHRILEHVRARLEEQLNSLTSQAISGGDINGTLGSTIRIAIAEGIRNEFMPEVKRYISRVEDALPETFQLETNFSATAPPSSTSTADHDFSVLTDILDVVTPLLTLGGKLSVLIPIMNVVAKLFDGLFSSNRRDVEEAERRELVRQQILNSVIPSAVSQTQNALSHLLQDKVLEIKAKISENVERQKMQSASALQELNKKLEQGKAAFSIACEKYNNDLQHINLILNTLEAE